MGRIRRWTIVAGITVALLLAGMASGWFIQPAQAQLGGLLKVGGVILVVSAFGGQINNFINGALGQREAAAAGATKVVPIFSVGRGTYVGAAQVVGLPRDVRQVQGVGALDLRLGNLNGTALVPISTQRPGGGSSLHRVSNVGISAVMDFHI